MIIPSLDILDNNIVRLYKGNYKQVKFYDYDLFNLAEKYKLGGAKILHIVDLSGSRNPKNRQIKLVEKIIKKIDLPIQIGGGIRSIKEIEDLLALGVSRIVIGSSAVTNIYETKKWFTKYSNNLVLAVDVVYRQNTFSEIKINGWVKSTGKDMIKLIYEYKKIGLKHLLCTDINKDGTLDGPNFNLYKNITRKFYDLRIQASGGISSIKDIENIKCTNVSSVIVGRALLEKRFNISEAIACWQKE
ncbi:1-(5-phosphoribosyl)-5-[(5-phosphoribosylamino)methylideneamino]imidazole-4-carboxamide isomerase [Buchnera aphidicola (Chaitoregma tattakana)]|uniref:1-(5-phosphoribosyl)-5-[(5- phosphoribosylamino)methylideneamino]imidazole-4- carboxamide isomerase n=1 Tax=Buchnera aphidicola TaxID=9 RepID=UPI0031B81171